MFNMSNFKMQSALQIFLDLYLTNATTAAAKNDESANTKCSFETDANNTNYIYHMTKSRNHNCINKLLINYPI